MATGLKVVPIDPSDAYRRILRDFGSGGGQVFDLNAYQRYGENVGQQETKYYESPPPPISMGVGAVPVLPARPSIPTVVPEYEVNRPDSIGFLPETLDRRDEPQEQEVIPMPVIVDDWNEYWALKDVGINVIHVSQQAQVAPSPQLVQPLPQMPTVPIVVPAVPINIPDSGEEGMGWLSDIYDLVDAAAGGVLPGGVPIGSVPITGGVPAVIQHATTPGIPPVTINQPGVVPMSAACDNDPMRGMVYKKVCGQYRWVKQKRRRRKALATKSDLQGLASLKGILGNGKAFEVWIATH